MLLKNACSKKTRCYSLPKILLIEDDQATADVLQQFFQMTGYICLLSRLGTDIIEIIANYRPNLIIIDYRLPQTNGADLCLEIKKNEMMRSIPVIIYSAYPISIDELARYGCTAFIAKPFDLDDIIKKVEQLLEESSYNYTRTLQYNH